MLRIDPKLYEELQRFAEVDFRSINGQIEFVLSEYVKGRRSRKQVEDLTSSDDES